MASSETKFLLVDAFATGPFSGNPAGVCILDAPASKAWMQSVATEMGFPATAFVLSSAELAAKLSWFTVNSELGLCGHGTLAAAHVLWELGLSPSRDEIIFETANDRLVAHRDGKNIELDFPIEEAYEELPPKALAQALGAPILRCIRNQYDYYCELQDDAAVRQLQPDLGLIQSLPVRCVGITSRSADPGFDFVSRVFAPQIGIREDQVTGSAHCTLGPYWAEKLGRTTLKALQASPRKGILDVDVDLDSNRVRLGGRAFTILSGNLSL